MFNEMKECTMSDLYKFQFDVNNTSVLQMWEVERYKTKLQKTLGSTFEVETGLNDSGLTGVLSVTQSKLSKGFAKTSVFEDQDGDGLFQQAFEIQVATSTATAAQLEKHKFSFDASGQVTADYELSKGIWKLEGIDQDEAFTVVSLDGVDYVVKTEQERDGVEFELFRDDNQDGVWTRIAEGEAGAGFVDASTGTVDLVGVQIYLDAAIGMVG
jgi:hypothetical protein